jgi:hypothetical protein
MTRRPEIRKTEEVVAAVKELRQTLTDATFTPPSRKTVLSKIEELRDELESISRSVDPVQLPDAFFDPSEPRLIGYFVALALISQDRRPLGGLPKFYGSGVYAIYYTGDHDLYAPISRTETPIYVGKADPPANATTVIQQEMKLHGRLDEHRKSITKVQGIEIKDFECRALAVQSGYQAAAEAHLIKLFRPIWNNETRILFGIGKHGDAATTRANNKSPWDTVHPGRAWAADNEEKKTADEIRAGVAVHFANSHIYETTEAVFGAFADGIRRADRIDADPEADPLPEIDD